MKLLNIYDNLFVKMDKAKTTKYIKRIPKPTGKGYYYFYNQKQIKDYKEKGKVPEEGKKEGGILSGIMSFFGFKDEKQATNKVKETFNANKKELSGVDIGTFTDYMNEYLSNKEKWDKKLSGKEKVVGKTKDGKKIVKKPSGQKKKSDSGKKWDMSLMKKVAGIVGGVKVNEQIKTKKDEFSKDGKLLDEKSGRPFEVFNQTSANLIVKKYKQQGIELKAERDSTGNYSFSKEESGDKNAVMSDEPKKIDKKDFPESISTIISNKDFTSAEGGDNRKNIERKIDKKEMKDGFEIFGERFIIARGQYGKWVVFEPKTGYSVGAGDTIKEAKESGIKTIQKAGEEKLKEALNRPKPELVTEVIEVKKPKEPEKTKEDILGKGFWNGKIYGRQGKFSIYVDGNKKDISNEEAKILDPSVIKGGIVSEEQKPANRMIYQPTKKQEEKWSKVETSPLPSDEEIKERWKKSHRGKEKGWGMLKKQLTIEKLKDSREYQIGLWQGKLDRVNGIEYSEERNDNTYNLGYYRGWDENPSGYINDVKKVNPNFSHLNDKELDKKEPEKPKEKESAKGNQAKYDQAKQDITKFEDLNYKDDYDTESDWIKEMEAEEKSVKESLDEDVEDGKLTRKQANEEMKESDYNVYKKNKKELKDLKEKLMGPKMFKAVKMDKAKTTKYIKRIPKPTGKGYYYFYNQKQIKDYKDKGTQPDKKKTDKKVDKPGGSAGKEDAKERLKNTLKKIANILAEALSGKDVNQPTGQAVEDVGESSKKNKKIKVKKEKLDKFKENKKKNDKGKAKDEKPKKE